MGFKSLAIENTNGMNLNFNFDDQYIPKKSQINSILVESSNRVWESIAEHAFAFIFQTVTPVSIEMGFVLLHVK